MKKLLVLLSITIFLNWCVVESRSSGCTDPYAANYQSSADYDNGSCDYTTDIVFYYSSSTATLLNIHADGLFVGVDELKFYIDNQYIGSEYAPFSFQGIPYCWQPSYVTTDILWSAADFPAIYQNDRNIIVDFEVEAIYYSALGPAFDLTKTIESGTLDLWANECVAVETLPILIKNQE